MVEEEEDEEKDGRFGFFVEFTENKMIVKYILYLVIVFLYITFEYVLDEICSTSFDLILFLLKRYSRGNKYK